MIISSNIICCDDFLKTCHDMFFCLRLKVLHVGNALRFHALLVSCRGWLVAWLYNKTCTARGLSI